MSVFFGCQKKSDLGVGEITQTVNDRTMRMPRMMQEESEDQDSDLSERAGQEQDYQDDADVSCDPNSQAEQCTLIPLYPETCLGCANGEGHRAVNKTAARRIMSPLKDKCMAKMRGFKGPQQGGASDESCKFNSATCSSEGRCVGVTLSQEELKRRHPERFQGQGGQGMGSQQGQGFMGGQGMGRQQGQGFMGQESMMGRGMQSPF